METRCTVLCTLLALAGGACPLPEGTCRDDSDCPVASSAAACQATIGQCVDGACTYPLRDDGPCDDGDGCTYDDLCDAQGLCRGLPLDCATPPAPVCASTTTLQVARAPGICERGACQFTIEPQPCAHGCQAGACRDDPCLDVRCDQPPPDRCRDPWTLEQRDPVGVCEDGTCHYPPLLVPCGRGCAGGRCQDGRAPVLLSFAASPSTVHYLTPFTRASWRAVGASSVRLEVAEDGYLLCDTAQGCAIEGTADEGEVPVEVPYQHSTLRLRLRGPGGETTAEVAVHILPPTYPELRFNDLGVWILTHQPVRPPYNFVVLNDIQYSQGECPRPEHAARLELKQQIVDLDPRPLFVLGVGDMLVNGKPCEYDQFVDDTLLPFYEEHGIPWLMVGGNHDLADVNAAATFVDVIGDHQLSFDLGGLRVLGSNHDVEAPPPLFEFGEPQASWLEAQLVQAEQLGRGGVIYAVHYPPRLPTDVGSCDTNLLHPYDHHFFDGRRSYDGADRFMALFTAHAPLAALALSGHAHVYANYVRDGVRYVVSGGGSSFCRGGAFDELEVPDNDRPFHDGAFNHFVRFTVLDDRELRYRGQVIKRGSDNVPSAHYDFDQDTDEPLQPALALPFVERFDDPLEKLDVWDFFTPYHDVLTPAGYSRWRRDSGALKHDGNLRHGTRASCWPACHGSLVRTWTRTWGDVRARVTVQGSAQPIVGLVVRYQDDTHYHRLALDRVAGQVVLTRHAGDVVELARVPAPATGTSVLLGLEAREVSAGTWLRGYLDGSLVIDVVDSDPGRPLFGGVGLTTYDAGAVWFDDVEVVAP